MELCEICLENDQCDETRCVKNHMMCSDCYKKLGECGYCRVEYILKKGCGHDVEHGNEMERSLVCDNFEWNDVVEGKCVVNIKHWTITEPCGDFVFGISRLYADCLEYAMLLMVADSDKSNELPVPMITYLRLPVGVRRYLDCLKKSERLDWLDRLRDCGLRLFWNLNKGEHIKCYMSGSKLRLCNCVGDEYMLYLVSKSADDIFESRVWRSPTELIDMNKCNMFQSGRLLRESQDRDFMLMDDEKLFKSDEMSSRKVWGEAYGTNICPCDWFMKFS